MSLNIPSSRDPFPLGLHALPLQVCTGMGTAGIPRNPREIPGNGYRYRGNTAVMELKLAGFPRVWDILSQEIRGVHLESLGAIDILDYTMFR